MSNNLPAQQAPSGDVVRWVMRPDLRMAVDSMLDELPQATGGDSLVEAILNAATPEALNLFDQETSKLERFAGRRVIVDNLKVLPSDHKGGNLGRYLIFEVVDDGELHTVSYGGQMTVLTLARLAQMGKLPAVCKFTIATTWNGEGRPPINVAYVAPAPTDRGFEFRPADPDRASQAPTWDDGERKPATAAAKVRVNAAKAAQGDGPGF